MADKPGTVDEYLDSLEPERRAVVSAMRDAVNEALPDGYEEALAYGMIGWQVPSTGIRTPTTASHSATSGSPPRSGTTRCT